MASIDIWPWVIIALFSALPSLIVAYFCYLCLRQAKEIHGKTLELANILYARTTRKPGRPRSGVVQREAQ